MKKTKLFSLVASLLLLVLSSCSKSGGTSGGGTGSGTGTYSMSCDINGVNYSWSGTYPSSSASAGTAYFTQASSMSNFSTISLANTLAVKDNSRLFTFYFGLNPAAGKYRFNTANSTEQNTVILTIGSFGDVASSVYEGSDFSVTIPSIPTKSYATHLAAAGSFKGTFEGTLYSITNKKYVITNGRFEALVLNYD
jgi:hypothetical protein